MGCCPPRSNREQYRRADVEKMEKGVVKRRNKQRGLRRKKQENKGGERGEIMSSYSPAVPLLADRGHRHKNIPRCHWKTFRESR